MSAPHFQPSIAIHGGAGHLARYEGTGRLEEAQAFLESLIDNLHDQLMKGATAIDVVTYAVTHLEDAGLFHAGKGSSPNTNGVVELDASIMDGSTLEAGAIAAVTGIKNPIVLARRVMESSPHVLLVGPEAERFGREGGVQSVEETYFVPCDVVGGALPAPSISHGTVGAVARDQFGTMAAATSTGGTLRKTAGRVGDTPIIGAGTYAANGLGAVSCTGVGEYFIRTTAAFQILSRVELLGETIGAAAGYVMTQIEELGGSGGMIAIGPRGEVAMPYNTTGMYRAAIDAWGKRTVAVL